MNQLDLHQQTLAEIEQVVRSRKDSPAQALGDITDLILRYRTSILAAMVVQSCGAVVQSGPFAGMNYVQTSACGPLLPKLLGCYEAELHGVIAEIVRRRYQTIVNIGCGEGYYAVGLARLLPQARVHAYEINLAGQRLCRELAGLNNVADRVIVHGLCDTAQLQKLAGQGVLVWCDCEGGEGQFLDPRNVPVVSRSDIVVELHQEFDATIADTLNHRFHTTHLIQHIAPGGRDWSQFGVLHNWKHLDQLLAMWEGRAGPTPWAWMTVRSPAAI